MFESNNFQIFKFMDQNVEWSRQYLFPHCYSNKTNIFTDLKLSLTFTVVYEFRKKISISLYTLWRRRCGDKVKVRWVVWKWAVMYDESGNSWHQAFWAQVCRLYKLLALLSLFSVSSVPLWTLWMYLVS